MGFWSWSSLISFAHLVLGSPALPDRDFLLFFTFHQRIQRGLSEAECSQKGRVPVTGFYELWLDAILTEWTSCISGRNIRKLWPESS